MRNLTALIVFLFFVIVAVVLYQKYNQNQLPFFKKTALASIDNHRFELLVANTSQEKQMGLSGRKSLPQNYGMIFPFKSPGFYPFWMKNMQFPIDIIYIYDGKITTVYANVQPPKSQNENDNPTIYTPKEPSNMVLEINSGLSQKYGFKKGDVVKLENL